MNFYRLFRPFIFSLPPEFSHHLGLAAMDFMPTTRPVLPPELALSLGDLTFPSPVGLAAGLDKNAAHLSALLGLGFGFIEAGSFTPKAKTGHPPPRLWRRTNHQGLINRLGLPNDGASRGAARLEKFRAQEVRQKQAPAIIGINIAPQEVGDKIAEGQWREDILAQAALFGRHASYLTVNLSSPNMAGLRDLQQAEPLRALLQELGTQSRVPLMLKLSPDINLVEMEAIVEAALEANLAALIMGNTTAGAGEPEGARAGISVGGLSGLPLRALARRQLVQLRRLTKGKIPLVSVGGVDSGQEVWERILAGASLVQIYTGMIFHGPGLVQTIYQDLAQLMAENKITSLKEAVGQGYEEMAKQWR